MGKKELRDKVTHNIRRDISHEHAVYQGEISKFSICPDVGFHELTIDLLSGL